MDTIFLLFSALSQIRLPGTADGIRFSRAFLDAWKSVEPLDGQYFNEGALRLSGVANAGTPFGNLHKVEKKHRPGHGANSARVRRIGGGFCAAGRVNIPFNRGFAGKRVERAAGDAHVDKNCPLPHHVGRDKVCFPGCADDDVRLSGKVGQVVRAGMTERDSGVDIATSEKKAERPSRRDAAANDDNVFPVKAHTRPSQKMQDASRRARQAPPLLAGKRQNEVSEARRAQAVDIFCRVDAREDGLLVDSRGQRQLDDVSRAGRVRVECINGCANFLLGSVCWQRAINRANANLPAITLFAGNVFARSDVIADKERAESGVDSALREGRDTTAQILLHLGCARSPVDSQCCHPSPVFFPSSL